MLLACCQENKASINNRDTQVSLSSELVVASVQNFIVILKEALFRFYKIQTLKRSQDDTLTAFITEQVLDAKVSLCLL